jgi:hypothetical protein
MENGEWKMGPTSHSPFSIPQTYGVTFGCFTYVSSQFTISHTT